MVHSITTKEKRHFTIARQIHEKRFIFENSFKRDDAVCGPKKASSNKSSVTHNAFNWWNFTLTSQANKGREIRARNIYWTYQQKKPTNHQRFLTDFSGTEPRTRRNQISYTTFPFRTNNRNQQVEERGQKGYATICSCASIQTDFLHQAIFPFTHEKCCCCCCCKRMNVLFVRHFFSLLSSTHNYASTLRCVIRSSVVLPFLICTRLPFASPRRCWTKAEECFISNAYSVRVSFRSYSKRG